MKARPFDINKFPQSPGVYIFKDKRGRVIYVGKAKNLKSRARAYVTGTDERPQIIFLRKKIVKADVIVTKDEQEALLLENSLIKEHQPKYNVLLKDDKQFFGIRLGLGHKFPNISLVRKVEKDGAMYFGPYASSTAAREIIYRLTRLFGLRTCSDRAYSNRSRPCLKKDLGKCLGPCAKNFIAEDYEKAVEAARLFLDGKNDQVLDLLRKRMEEASREMKYEEASRLRDAIFMIEEALEKQRVVDYRGGDADCWAIAQRSGVFAASLIEVRQGIVLKSRLFKLGKLPSSSEQVMRDALLSYYGRVEKTSLPHLVIATPLPLEKDLLGQALHIEICHVSSKWEGPASLAVQNAESFLAGKKDVVGLLKKWLKLSRRPELIEAVDVSHLGGEGGYGSLIAFSNGNFVKSRYRLFKMEKSFDDYKMMKELLSRRLKYGNLPDLLLIDGGKGQLNAAVAVARELGLDDLELAAIAKGKNGETDKLFRPMWKDAKRGKREDSAYLLLAKIRDEAHRFGISTQRRSRKKRFMKAPRRD